MTVAVELIVNQLKEVLTEEQVSTNETVRQLHGRDESHHSMSLPDIVVFPRSTADVSAILKIAHVELYPSYLSVLAQAWKEMQSLLQMAFLSISLK